MITPSIFCLTVSSWNLILISIILVRFFLIIKISFRAGGKSSPPQDATTRVRLSRKIFPLIICFIAVSILSRVISERIPLLPPTLIVSKGISLSKFLNALSVVPSPPSVTMRSNFSFFKSCMVSTFLQP